jgi:hypothetical protein
MEHPVAKPSASYFRITSFAVQTKLIAIAVATLALTASAYADAVFNVDESTLPNGQQINFRTSQTGTLLEGFAADNTAMPVHFSSTEVLTVGTGKSPDITLPSDTPEITNMTIMSPGNIFTGLDIDVFQPVNPNVMVRVTMTDGKTFDAPSGWAVDSSNNYLQITTEDGEMISTVMITSAGFRRIRKDLIAGVARAHHHHQKSPSHPRCCWPAVG